MDYEEKQVSETVGNQLSHVKGSIMMMLRGVVIKICLNGRVQPNTL